MFKYRNSSIGLFQIQLFKNKLTFIRFHEILGLVYVTFEKCHYLRGYRCYLCGGKLSKRENINTAFAVQLGLRSGDSKLAVRDGFKDILKHHVQCGKCGLIICRSCQQINKTNRKWHNWPYCPNCGSKMVYV